MSGSDLVAFAGVALAAFAGAFAAVAVSIWQDSRSERGRRIRQLEAVLAEADINEALRKHNARAAEQRAKALFLEFRSSAAHKLLLGGSCDVTDQTRNAGNEYLIATDHVNMMMRQSQSPTGEAIAPGLMAAAARYCAGKLEPAERANESLTIPHTLGRLRDALTRELAR